METTENLDQLLALEAELTLTRLDAEIVWKLGRWLADKARRESLKIAVLITRSGQRAFQFDAEGTSPDNDSWLDRKTKTVLRFGHSSLYMGRKLAQSGATPGQKYGLSESEFSFHGGAFPLRIKNAGLIGVLAVSGLTQEADHELAVAALRHILS